MKTLIPTFVAFVIAASTVMAQSAPVELVCEIQVESLDSIRKSDVTEANITITEDSWTIEGTKKHDGTYKHHEWTASVVDGRTVHSSVYAEGFDNHFNLSVHEITLYEGFGIKNVKEFSVYINRKDGKLGGSVKSGFLSGRCYNANQNAL